MREERVILEHEADAAPVRRDSGEIESVEQHSSRIGALQPGDHAQQRRLARPAGAEHRDHLAGADVERGAVERILAVERHADALHLEH